MPTFAELDGPDEGDKEKKTKEASFADDPEGADPKNQPRRPVDTSDSDGAFIPSSDPDAPQ